jgi:integrase
MILMRVRFGLAKKFGGKSGAVESGTSVTLLVSPIRRNHVRHQSHSTCMSQPYNRTQLRALQATMAQRWPKLPQDEAEKWLTRFKEGRAPYSRVRVQAIRCQLDAIVALALHQGLRRSEIFRANVHDLSSYNSGVVVRDRSGSLGAARQVPSRPAHGRGCEIGRSAAPTSPQTMHSRG